MNLTSSARYRLAMFAASVLLFAPLGIAVWLTPAPSGLGTHQQLGLPPCTMRMLFGIRCPGCGMTTSWAWFVRGHWWTSLQTNAAGTLFAFLDAWVAMSCVYFGWTNQRPTKNWSRMLVMVLIVGMSLAFIIWVGRLFSGDW